MESKRIRWNPPLFISKPPLSTRLPGFPFVCFSIALHCPLPLVEEYFEAALLTWRADREAQTVASMAASAEGPIGVLFVCLGNICRSPTAEAVFINAVKKRGLESQFKIDSAGTINYHEGDPADSRMRAAALRRGVKLESISRPVRPSDFNDFDYILAMDKQNREDLFRLHKNWRKQSKLPEITPKKVQLMCDYCTSHKVKEVPDPYYGGPQGFEEVLDLLEDACDGFLESIVTKD